MKGFSGLHDERDERTPRAVYGLSVLARFYSDTRDRRTDTGCRLEIDTCRKSWTIVNA